MQQPHQSAIEIVTGTIAGFALAWVVGQWIIYPYYGLTVDHLLNLKMTGWFTVVSIARGYVWRRFFNRFDA